MRFAVEPNLVQAHRRWLSAFDPQYLHNWGKLMDADAEAAACEAAVCRLLEKNGNRVEPNEDLTGCRKSPDFRCTQAGELFFVEVTRISIEKATEITSLPHPPSVRSRAQHYGQLNRLVFNAVKEKTPQCSGLDRPALVAVGTFHSRASCICFHREHVEMLLTGQELITQRIDTRTGHPVGGPYLSTELQSATFLRPDNSTGMRDARNPVSGILLCGFGCNPPGVRGVLHPKPVHDFNRNLLPAVEFCRLRTGCESGDLSSEWV